MKDWTKGGEWKVVSIYIYGLKRECFHLCFYKDAGYSLIMPTDQEFEITNLIPNLGIIKMLHPVVDEVEFRKMYDTWCAPSPDIDIQSLGKDLACVVLGDNGEVDISYI